MLCNFVMQTYEPYAPCILTRGVDHFSDIQWGLEGHALMKDGEDGQPRFCYFLKRSLANISR